MLGSYCFSVLLEIDDNIISVASWLILKTQECFCDNIPAINVRFL